MITRSLACFGGVGSRMPSTPRPEPPPAQSVPVEPSAEDRAKAQEWWTRMGFAMSMEELAQFRAEARQEGDRAGYKKGQRNALLELRCMAQIERQREHYDQATNLYGLASALERSAS